MKYSIFILLILTLLSCGEELQPEPFVQIIIDCDAETVSGNNFISGQDTLEGGQTQSSDFSRSGDYSTKLNNAEPFAFAYSIYDIKIGDVIDASVWVHQGNSNAQVIISDRVDNGFSESYDQVELIEGDWGSIRGYFIANQSYEELTVYILNFDAEPAYTDDFHITISKNNAKPDLSNEALEISLSQEALDSLSLWRDKALEQGVITGDLKNYLDATILVNGEEIPVELRLKGDWTDHLTTDKWSFRIKVKGENSFRELKSFSIQNPSTRSFMDEWFAHKMFEKEGVLTTRYTFIPVIINGEQKGVYALEEHFDKQLLEHSERREGPIVKFDESGVWQVHQYESRSNTFPKVPIFESAEITPFKKNRTRKSPVLSAQFKVAQEQMSRLRSHDPNVFEYLDVEAYVKYIALSDVLNGDHGQIWHNLRAYYNPITRKLEPIAYDCFVERKQIDRTVTITGFNRREKEYFNVLEAILSNEEAEAMYLNYLKLYSNDVFLNETMSSLTKEIEDAEKLLKNEYPGIELDRGIFMGNVQTIRQIIPEYEEFTLHPNKESSAPVTYEALPENVIFTDIALKAYIRDTLAYGKFEVHFENFHTSNVEVIGYAVKANKDSLIPIPSFGLDGFSQETEVKNIHFDEKPKVFFYTAENCSDRVFRYKLGKWSEPTMNDQPDRIVLKGEETIRLHGNLLFEKDVYVPRGHKLIIEEGTVIKFNNGAGFISESPVDMQGTSSHPIIITSEDSTASGFTVIAPGSESKMSYVEFSNLNTMNKNNWILTGAVTVYESDITIDNCSFYNNQCEDGLNLIRCSFLMTNSSISNTLSDGFDADFCTGTIEDSEFSNTGNDCLDFSGSEITISLCQIENAGDKGISGGEGSHLTIIGCNISNVNIGIASKDNSMVIVQGGTVMKSRVAYAAYRKKPEYGAATIFAEHVNLHEIEEIYLLDKGSKLTLDGESFEGTEVFNIEEMYAAFQK
ncbi:MAG: CotH kinase family protein [Crocinitomicaceae bacterium]|nr:CotH kinase family protein [Crocinitomicaceae bacterium]